MLACAFMGVPFGKRQQALPVTRISSGINKYPGSHSAEGALNTSLGQRPRKLDGLDNKGCKPAPWRFYQRLFQIDLWNGPSALVERCLP